MAFIRARARRQRKWARAFSSGVDKVNRKLIPILGATLAAGLGLTMGQTAVATPTDNQDSGVASVSGEPRTVSQDDLPNPLEDKRRALREEAVSQVLNGEAKPQKRGKSTVVKLGGDFGRGARDKGRKPAEYVEVARQSTDRVFVVLAEFGNERHPSYPDQDTDPETAGPTRFDGPLHNQIPKPDRAKDNSTVWKADYNRDHFQNTYFGAGKNAESLKTYYEKQSSGRFSVSGDGDRLGQGALQRGPLRPFRRLPVR